MSIATAFDADTHTYTIDGRRVPSVTQILNAVIPRRFEADSFYLGKGRALHAAIELDAAGQLDVSSLDERLLPRLEAFRKFMRETGGLIRDSEIRIFSRQHNFAGTLDCRLQMDCGDVLTDWKSSPAPQTLLQLGAYSILWGEKWGTTKGTKPAKGVAVHLQETGSYTCAWFDRRALEKGARQFLAALTVYGFMQQNNLLPKGQE